MNATPPVSPSTPPAPLNGVQMTMPTLGAILGSALGQYLSVKAGSTDPLMGQAIVTATSALVTGVFHWAGLKIGL